MTVTAVYSTLHLEDTDKPAFLSPDEGNFYPSMVFSQQ